MSRDRLKLPAQKRPGQLPRQAKRLLALLAETDLNVSVCPDAPAELSVVRRMRGTSLAQGRFDLSTGEWLVAEDLAVWRNTGARRTLQINQTGRACLAREDASGDLAFTAQHATLASRALDDGAVALVNDAESPLAWLHRRRGKDGKPLIDAAAFAVGERLRADLTIAGLMPRVTSDWSQTVRGGGGGPAAATDMMIAARQRVRSAMKAVGPDLADLLIDVCGFLKSLSEVEHERGWPSRSAKVVLNLALDRLCDHYGIEREARGREASRGITLWLSEDELAGRAFRRQEGREPHPA